ncbi:hypothetical protein AB833_18005 [Chromatiales bacterium (ex Bugula neritina AB1)]|nr:hypothetical protein AB833_18005 [Chromatiales bacterium (ex Bugula neritina AB1)]
MNFVSEAALVHLEIVLPKMRSMADSVRSLSRQWWSDCGDLTIMTSPETQETEMSNSTINTALLVIDVQRSFEEMPFWSEDSLQDYQFAQNALIAHARALGWPVVFVYHTGRGVFSIDSGFVEPMDWVDRQAGDPVFYKRVHNALSESGLQPWLVQRGISHLVVSGIRTEQCCETTARFASDAGFEVDFILDATHTFAMSNAAGDPVPAIDIKLHTATVLQHRFAVVQTFDNFALVPERGTLNRHCPRSGKMLASDSLTEYRGYQVGFCNSHCSSGFTSDPVASHLDRLYFDRLIVQQAGVRSLP